MNSSEKENSQMQRSAKTEGQRTLGSLACVCAFVHVFPVQARRQRRHLTPSSLRSPAWGDDVNTPGITLIKTKVAEAGDPIPWACLEMKVSLLSFGS